MAADLSGDAELLAGFLDETAEQLAEVEQTLAQLGLEGELQDQVAALFRAVHSIKGNSSFFGLTALQRLAHRLEDVLDAVRQGRRTIDEALVALLVRGTDRLSAMVERLQAGEPELEDEPGHEAFLEVLEQALVQAPRDDDLILAIARVRDVLPSFGGETARAVGDLVQLIERFLITQATPVPTPAGPDNGPDAGLEGAASDTGGSQRSTDTESQQRSRSESQRRSVRVDESAIDELLQHVGELVVVGDMMRHLRVRIDARSSDQDLRQSAHQTDDAFADISAKLQAAVMGVRQVPGRNLLRKVPKLVRDAARSLDKEIESALEGEQLMIDKSYLELLDAPLTHLVRNACDHGVERPAERTAAGKETCGTVTVRLFEDGPHLVLAVADNGGGIRMDKVRAKAEARGLLAPGAAFGEQELLDCLTRSGFSTADQVTDISGRGVGMDVVRRSIEEAGGAMALTTTAGAGTTWTVRVPKNVSTQIVSGYFVRIAEDHFIFPLEVVREAVAGSDLERTQVTDRGAFVVRRGRSIAVIDLRATMALGGQAVDTGVYVLIEHRANEYAVLVDAVVGVKTMVKLPLVGLEAARGLFQGAAMLGDGSVGLILDIDGLIDG